MRIPQTDQEPSQASSYKGVTYERHRKALAKWRAVVKLAGHKVHIAYCFTEKEAVQARNAYIQKHELGREIQPWAGPAL